MSLFDDPVMVNDWHPVATVGSLDDGRPLGSVVLGEAIVLWRHGDQLHAWQDLCVHRGSRLSLGRVEGDTLVCPYHGWTYDGSGRCVRIPALPGHTPPDRARVKTYHVCERYGLVWVCLGQPEREPPPFPEWSDGRFRKLLCGPYRVNASGPRMIENFLDVAHFPFVHADILGSPGHTEIDDYQAVIGPEGVEATDVRVYQPDPYGTGQGDTVSYTYRAYRPFTAYLLKQSAGPKFSIFFTITPHAPTESSGWMWMALKNYGDDIPDARLIAWQDQIFVQDQPIVESQRPELLPLDLQAELNMRCDRTAVMYRRWLQQLGLRFGVT